MKYKFFNPDEIAPDYRPLYESMKSELVIVCDKKLKIISEATEAQKIAWKSAMELMKIFTLREPQTLEDEIAFFKEVKPKFYSAWIYWTEVRQIEMHLPIGAKKKIKKYLLDQISALNNFFNRHISFYLYYRAGATHNDEIFFSRKFFDNSFYHQSNLLDFDRTISTGYDFLLSSMFANEQLIRYIKQKIQNNDETKSEKEVIKSNLQWTNKKVALAELIYAFHATGVFNNAQPDINFITQELCNLFGIDMPNIYKIFEEIRIRKKNRTSFLDSLKLNLLRKMDEDDAHTL
ncbi:MAG: RteC domain-containing protein [Bacteroidetes bacterium]|nr:RteC domain-containing protein [Bacteroidota bacterium]